MKSPREYTGRGRLILLVAAVVALVVLTAGLIAIALLSARVSISTVDAILSGQRHLSGSDRLLLITAEIAVAAFLLAVLAAVFAILAYGVATRTPNIEVEFVFPGCQPNKPVVCRAPADNAGPGVPLQPKTQTGPLRVEVAFISKNRWTAEHLLLRVWLLDMVLPAGWASANWDRAYGTPPGYPFNMFQISEPYPRVYGRVMGHVWPLDLSGLRLTGENPTIYYFVSAHGGFLRIKKIPVQVE